MDIRYLEGETKGILIVAPHGPYETKDDKIKYRNDKRTGIIAEEIHNILGCFTIINDAYIKPDEEINETASLKDKRLDLFKVKQAEKVPGYLKAIKDAVDNHVGKTLVIWLHGIHDNNADSQKIEHVKANLMKEGDGDLHALIGYGQGKPSRYTAEQKTVDTIRDELTKRGLRTVITRKDAGNYRGRDTDRLNQWFRKGKNTFDKVETFQIEIREKGFREDAEQCLNTAKIIADAISATLEMKPVVMKEAVLEAQPVKPTASNRIANTLPTEVPVPVQDNEAEIVQEIEEPLVEQTASNKTDTENTVPTDIPVLVQVIEPEIVQGNEDPLVADAFEYLKNSFRQHFHDAMLEAGRYLVDKFYDKDYNWARQGKKPKKKGSLNKLIERLQANSGDAPSKTWIYDALKLAVDDHFYNVEGGKYFRAFGKLGHTQKLRIAYVKQPDIKERLIEEIADQEEPLTDQVLRERIAKEKEKIPKKKRVPSIFQAKNNPLELEIEEIKEFTRFDRINSLDDDEIDKFLNSNSRLIDRVKSKIDRVGTKIEKLKNEIENYKTELSIYEHWNNRFSIAKEWHETLKKRKSGDDKVKYPKITRRLKKLRNAVQFMCFWKRYNYSEIILEIPFEHKYIPLEEASENVLEYLLRKGRCDLKASYNFEVTKEAELTKEGKVIKKGKVKLLSQRQVSKRIEEGTFWLSAEKYGLLQHSGYFDYK